MDDSILTNLTSTPASTPPSVVPATRDGIRNILFASPRTKLRSKQVYFFDALIEIRQPSLGGIIDTGEKYDDNQSAVVTSLIENAYVPGTNEHVFSIEDADALRALPFGKDFQTVMEASQELQDLKTEIPTKSA